MTTKLSEAICQKELETIGRKNLMRPLRSVHVENCISEVLDDPIAYMMSTSVTFRTTATVKQDFRSKNDGAITETKRRMARIIINEVFGEFREDFDNLRRALCNFDVDEAMRIAETFEQRMFEV